MECLGEHSKSMTLLHQPFSENMTRAVLVCAQDHVAQVMRRHRNSEWLMPSPLLLSPAWLPLSLQRSTFTGR